ncbi:hypothetical protein [Burkholderia stagnalis]|uniref:hypothetical protein n=1 Tax=Burkholderia stagnalis TaxID=1503054 RepID=UPI000F5ADDA1|nr:hypothetical protein [Burkholderia stagnalis]
MDAAALAYAEHPEFPGLFTFRCERLRADLTASACARSHAERSALACVGCAIGRKHADDAGIASAPVAKRTALGSGQVDYGRFAPVGGCVRCGRTYSRADRSFKPLRLVRAHTICVSCFNREKEVEHGANAKGAKPRKWTLLLRPTLLELECEGKRRVVDVGLCSGRTEAERLAARRWPGVKLLDVVQDGSRSRLPAHLRTGILPAGRIEQPTTPSERRTQRAPARIKGL